MSTEQRYTGKGDNASSTSQTVNSDQKRPLSAAERQRVQLDIDYLQRKRGEDIKRVFREINLFGDTADDQEGPTESLCVILQNWVTTEYKRIARTSDGEEMDYWDGHVRNVMDTISYVAYLRKLAQTVQMHEDRINELTLALSAQ